MPLAQAVCDLQEGKHLDLAGGLACHSANPAQGAALEGAQTVLS